MGRPLPPGWCGGGYSSIPNPTGSSANFSSQECAEPDSTLQADTVSSNMWWTKRGKKKNEEEKRKNREPKVGSLERRILILVQQEEVLGLEVPVHHPHGMAGVDDLHDRPQQRRGRPLRVVAPGDDAIEQLPSRAQLHDEVHRLLVLESPLQLHDVGLPRQVVHDLDLPPDVLDVLLVGELPLRDGLAGVLLPGGLVGAKMGDAELAAPQLLPEGVSGADVLHGPAEHGADGSGRLRGRAEGGGGYGCRLDGGVIRGGARVRRVGGGVGIGRRGGVGGLLGEAVPHRG
ncbi:hypothetical protein MUK42_07639 [Musa troglodytarum]|uniref:Uncharacterized protein n=1 Tax=Musa troglodytarum TaxID=320322 RepID=A0A9E7FZI2_9LILI|nr:hypothetical protein MUK42_07639 [Musa troglodytarum]